MSRSRRRAAVLLVLVLAPFVGEFVLGNLSLTEHGAAWPLLVPMYGGGALLVRELSVRAGRGWPSVIALGAAYGTLECGLFDQSLFAPPQLQGLDAAPLFVPALGLDPGNYLTYVSGHVVWSLWIPIVLAETLTARTTADRRTAWLGPFGLAATGALYLGGGALVAHFTVSESGSVLTVPRVLGVLVVTAVLVALGLLLRSPASGRDGRVPAPLLVAAGAFLVAAAVFLAPEGWPSLVLRLAGVALAVAALGRWSARSGWTESHRVAAALGALLVYTGAGFALTALYGRSGMAVWVGQAVAAALSLLLMIVAVRAVSARSATLGG